MATSADERLGLLLKRAEQALINVKNAALRPVGLTVPQYAALLFLQDEPGLSSSALARRVLVTPQTMGPVLDTLETRGLVEKRPHRVHRRVVEIFVTRQGEKVLRDADLRALRVEAQLVNGMSESQQKQLRKLLERAIANLRDQKRSNAA